MAIKVKLIFLSKKENGKLESSSIKVDAFNITECASVFKKEYKDSNIGNLTTEDPHLFKGETDTDYVLFVKQAHVSK